MHAQIWVVSTLLISIVLIVLTIVKFKFHPFLALLLASFFVGAMMGMGPLEMVTAIETDRRYARFSGRRYRSWHHPRQNDGGFRRGGTHRAYSPALPLALS